MGLMLSFFLLWSCEEGPPRSKSEEVLAEIEDRVITLEEFKREIEELPEFLKPMLIEPEAKKEFLRNLVDRELLLLEASKRGMDKEEEVLRRIERCKKAVILEAFLDDLFRGKDEVAEEEISRFYEENKEKFQIPERIRVRDIVVKTREEAEEIKRRIAQGEDFAELARRYSISPTAKRGGDLGYIERGQVGKEFERAAFSLKELGEVSDIVKTTFGYHIIRLEDRQEARQRTLDEVRDEIRQRLRERKRKEILEAHLKELRQKYRVTIREELLEGEGQKK